MAKEKGANTTLLALNDILFQQLESLTNADLKGDQLKEEVERSKAVGMMAKNIINNGSLVLQAKRLSADVKGDYEKSNFLEG